MYCIEQVPFSYPLGLPTSIIPLDSSTFLMSYLYMFLYVYKT